MSESVRSHGFTAFGPVHEGLARLRGWSALAVAALLGAFTALAFAPFFIAPVLIISFTGLIWMIDGARGVKRWGRAVFARGWAFGFGSLLAGMHWTAAPFLVEPEKHAIFLWLPLIVQPGGIAIIWGVAIMMATPQMMAMPPGCTISGNHKKIACFSGSTRKGAAVQCIPASSEPKPKAQPRANTARPQRLTPRAPSIIQISPVNEMIRTGAMKKGAKARAVKAPSRAATASADQPRSRASPSCTGPKAVKP